MPRVGSFSRMMRGAIISHLPITSFCWLPPDSDPAAGSVPSLRTAEQLHDALDRLALGRAVDDAPARQLAERGEREVVAHRHRQHQALGLAVLGDQRHADRRGAWRRSARRCRTGRPSISTSPRGAAQHAEQRQQQLALALAVEAAEADHLAGAQAQRDVVEPVAPAQVAQLEPRHGVVGGGAAGLGGNTPLYSRPIISSTTSWSVFVPAA